MKVVLLNLYASKVLQPNSPVHIGTFDTAFNALKHKILIIFFVTKFSCFGRICLKKNVQIV